MYSFIERKGGFGLAATIDELENTTLNERSQLQGHMLYDCLYEMFRIVKFLEQKVD